MRPIQVLCVDDNTDVLAALKALISRTPGLACVGALSTAKSLSAEVAARRPDVLLLDIHMPPPDPLLELRELHNSGAPVKTIILSADTFGTVEFLDEGADACLSKDSDPAQIVDMILSLGPAADPGDEADLATHG